jgi:hypothetical protein
MAVPAATVAATAEQQNPVELLLAQSLARSQGVRAPGSRSRWWWYLGIGLALAVVAIVIAAVVRAARQGGGGAGQRTLPVTTIRWDTCQGNQCGDFAIRGTDSGSGSGMGATFYGATTASGQGALGDYAECRNGCDADYRGGFTTNTTSVVVGTSADLDPAIRPLHPLSFTDPYVNSGDCANFSLWRGVCPAGYTMVGDVHTRGTQAPDVTGYYCVPEWCTAQGRLGPRIWGVSSDSCSDGVGIVSVEPANPNEAYTGNFFTYFHGGQPYSADRTRVLLRSCTYVPATPPPAADLLAPGEYTIRWQPTGQYMGSAAQPPSGGGDDVRALLQASPDYTWIYAQGILAPGALAGAVGCLYARSDTTGAALPASAFVSAACSVPINERSSWRLARDPQGRGYIYNAYFNSCMVPDASGNMVLYGTCGDAAKNWTITRVPG